MSGSISPNHRVTLTLGVCASAITTIVACTWKLSTILSELNSTMKTLDSRVGEIEKTRFRLSDAAEVALRTAIENPSMRVPDPREPSRIIAVVPHSEDSHKP